MSFAIPGIESAPTLAFHPDAGTIRTVKPAQKIGTRICRVKSA
jgi:hypothetical protein